MSDLHVLLFLDDKRRGDKITLSLGMLCIDMRTLPPGACGRRNHRAHEEGDAQPIRRITITKATALAHMKN